MQTYQQLVNTLHTVLAGGAGVGVNPLLTGLRKRQPQFGVGTQGGE